MTGVACVLLRVVGVVVVAVKGEVRKFVLGWKEKSLGSMFAGYVLIRMNGSRRYWLDDRVQKVKFYCNSV